MSLKHSIQTLAELAKECKMAIRPTQSVAELQQNIAHTKYVAAVLHEQWQQDHTVSGSIFKHSSYRLVLEHLENLEANLHEAVLREDFHNQSI